MSDNGHSIVMHVMWYEQCCDPGNILPQNVNQISLTLINENAFGNSDSSSKTQPCYCGTIYSMAVRIIVNVTKVFNRWRHKHPHLPKLDIIRTITKKCAYSTPPPSPQLPYIRIMPIHSAKGFPLIVCMRVHPIVAYGFLTQRTIYPRRSRFHCT